MKLDIGCGKNKREGFTGLDIDPDSGADIIASALDLSFPDGSVDEINSWHLVEHFTPDETRKFFSEVYRVLKKGGTAEMKIDRDWTNKRLLKKDPTHKYRFDAEEIKQMVSKFSEAKVENKIYFINFYTPRNKIFVFLKK